jgi:hypothetical protein
MPGMHKTLAFMSSTAKKERKGKKNIHKRNLFLLLCRWQLWTKMKSYIILAFIRMNKIFTNQTKFTGTIVAIVLFNSHYKITHQNISLKVKQAIMNVKGVVLWFEYEVYLKRLMY